MKKGWGCFSGNHSDHGWAGTGTTRGCALFIFLLLMLVAAIPARATAEQTDGNGGWKFNGDLYLWAIGIGGETADGDDIDISVDDVVDNLEFAAMGGIHALNGRWHIATDLMYLNLNEENEGAIGLPGRPGIKARADVDLEAWVVTPVIGYRFIDTGTFRMEILGGARYLYLKSELSLNVTGPVSARDRSISESADNWDGIGGIRGDFNLTKHWYFPFYADIGAGDSDLTWQAMTGIGYRFCRVDVIAAYRYLEWQFEENKVLDSLDISGPLVGVRFKF